MEIKEPGTYEVMLNFSLRGKISIKQIPKGSIIAVTQVDELRHKIIGPEFPDWCYWELPVKKL
jgi:hypothetical protein